MLMYDVLQPRQVQVPGFGWPHEIRIALPPTYRMDPRAYPVLWVTDGSAMFDVAMGTLKLLTLAQELPEFILIGIGAPPDTSVPDMMRRRVFDFYPMQSLLSPPETEAVKAENQEDIRLLGGGAEAFLNFLVGELRSQLAGEFRFDEEAHCLAGHSAGGYFSCYSLLTQPTAFASYVIGSPPLGYCDNLLFDLEEKYANERDDLVAKVFVGLGEREIDDYGDIVTSTTTMLERLRGRGYPSLSLTTRIFSGQTHTAAGIPLFSEGLRALFPTVPLTLDEQMALLK